MMDAKQTLNYELRQIEAEYRSAMTAAAGLWQKPDKREAAENRAAARRKAKADRAYAKFNKTKAKREKKWI
jgi:hypothetical protein